MLRHVLISMLLFTIFIAMFILVESIFIGDREIDHCLDRGGAWDYEAWICKDF